MKINHCLTTYKTKTTVVTIGKPWQPQIHYGFATLQINVLITNGNQYSKNMVTTLLP